MVQSHPFAHALMDRPGFPVHAPGNDLLDFRRQESGHFPEARLGQRQSNLVAYFPPPIGGRTWHYLP